MARRLRCDAPVGRQELRDALQSLSFDAELNLDQAIGGVRDSGSDSRKAFEELVAA